MPEPEVTQTQTTTVPPETGTPPAGETPPAGTQTPPTLAELTAERDRIATALKAANREAAERRKKLEALEQAEAKRQQAEMTEAEKAKAAKDELETKYTQLVAQYDGLRLRQAFFDEVARQSVTFASEQARADAYELAELAAVLEGGEVQAKALSEAVKALQRTRPYLFGQAATAPDIGATARGGADGLPEVTDQDIQEFAATYGISPQFVDKRAVAQAKRLAKGKS